MKRLSLFYQLMKEAAQQGSADKMPTLGAALAFYSILSLGPLLLLLLAGASLVFGNDEARNRIIAEFGGLVGEQGTQTIQDILSHASPMHMTGTTLLGVVTLLLGASGVFGQLQDSLNIVWKVKEKSGAVKSMIWQRFLSFTMVLGSGFLLLASFVISAVLAAVKTYMTGLYPVLAVIMQLIDIVTSFSLAALLFALIFKFVPDSKIAWRCAWGGGMLTAILFTIGKFLIGFYLSHAGVASSYGAAGSAIIILLWIYYSSQILLFGAEVTRAFANHRCDNSVFGRLNK